MLEGHHSFHLYRARGMAWKSLYEPSPRHLHIFQRLGKKRAAPAAPLALAAVAWATPVMAASPSNVLQIQTAITSGLGGYLGRETYCWEGL